MPESYKFKANEYLVSRRGMLIIINIIQLKFSTATPYVYNVLL